MLKKLQIGTCRAYLIAVGILVIGTATLSANTYVFNEVWDGSGFGPPGALWMQAQPSGSISSFTYNLYSPASGYTLEGVYYATSSSASFTPTDHGDYVPAVLNGGNFSLAGAPLDEVNSSPFIAHFVSNEGNFSAWVGDGIGIPLPPVPDASSTLLLMGFAFLGLATMRRKLPRNISE